MEQSLDISWKTIIKVLITGFSLYLLFLSRDIVIWLAFALIIALLIEPMVNWLRWIKFPRVLAVILVYSSILGALGLMVYFTAPIFIFAFYNSLEEKGPEKVLSLLVPQKYEASVLHIFEKAQFKVANWFGARILACIFVGIASFVAFFLFDIKYAFILSLISGVLTFVPFIGPLITGILAFLFVGTSNSWLTAVYVI